MRAALLRLLDGEYEGDLDARDLASRTGLPLEAVQRELHAMAEAGLLEPRAYRLHRHGCAGSHLGLTTLQAAVVRALAEKGPLSRDALALFAVGQAATGGLKAALKDLCGLYGQVSPARCPWVSGAGRAWLAEHGGEG